MFTVEDTFVANGITKVLFVADEKFGDFVFMYDFMGNTAVLDPWHYAEVFSKVFDSVRFYRQPDRYRVATLEFFVFGEHGWHLKARTRTRALQCNDEGTEDLVEKLDPAPEVDLDAAFAAFLDALKRPD